MAGVNKRRGDVVVPSADDFNTVHDEEDNEFEEDEKPVAGSSRYQADLIELGLLG